MNLEDRKKELEKQKKAIEKEKRLKADIKELEEEIERSKFESTFIGKTISKFQEILNRFL